MISQSPEISVPEPRVSLYELRLSQLEETLDWHTIFGNHNPVVIELGCGKGRFIIRSALQDPGTNYFGIERSLKFFRLLRERAAKAGVTNLRLLRYDAAYFLEKFVPPASVLAFHIYFPDPWPKKRHRKRRLVNPAFMAVLTARLQPRGQIFFATDFEDYFTQMLTSSEACPDLEQVACLTLEPTEANAAQALTNYERKYLLQGRPIYKAVYQKRDACR